MRFVCIRINSIIFIFPHSLSLSLPHGGLVDTDFIISFTIIFFFFAFSPHKWLLDFICIFVTRPTTRYFFPPENNIYKNNIRDFPEFFLFIAVISWSRNRPCTTWIGREAIGKCNFRVPYYYNIHPSSGTHFTTYQISFVDQYSALYLYHSSVYIPLPTNTIFLNTFIAYEFNI